MSGTTVLSSSLPAATGSAGQTSGTGQSGAMRSRLAGAIAVDGLGGLVMAMAMTGGILRLMI